MKYKAHDYQQYATDFIIEHPVSCLILDMGLGKTVITLTALWLLLFDYFEVRRILVIAPKRVAETTWPAEIKKWEHLYGMTFAVAMGTAEQRKEALLSGADVTIVGRDNVSWMTKNIFFDFDMVIIDELSSFKSPKAQMANGAVYDESGNVRNIHDRKLDALEDLIESANGKPLLVAYWFKHDRERILKRFPARDINTKKDIEDWNEGKIPVALIHPASAGHGLNLQEGGSTIVWFSLTWSLELYQQLNARLYRQGQKHTVIIEHLVTEGTVDEDILRAIGKKDTTQNAMIEAVKARIGGMTDDGRSNDEGI